MALNAAGIPSVVATNNTACLLRYVQGVQLLVRREELEAAHEILRTLDAPEDTTS